MRTSSEIPTIPPLGYRPGIDGLRALAVLAVVGYHLEIPGFGGGFVGVDVFFVISGYLISWLLLDEQRSGADGILWRFYARRVRRLLPAFAVVIVATVAMSCLILQPVLREPQVVANTAAAAAGLGANLFLQIASHGYFETPASQLPLMHTWTLSVEEQFYLVWPLLVLVAIRSASGNARRRLTVCLFGVATLSIVGEIALTLRGHYRAAFFQTPARAWEFAAGALLLVARDKHSRWFPRPSTSAWLGMSALLASVVWLSAADVWPGILALIPVAATILLIEGIATPGSSSLVARLLESSPMVWVGVRSYSLYLWHFPLLGLWHARFGPRFGLPGEFALLVLSLGLSDLSFRFVERPVRRRLAPGAPAARVVAVGAIALLALAVGARAVRWRIDAREPNGAVARAFNDRPANAEECMHSPVEELLKQCWTRRSDAPQLVVLWGDSFANMWGPAVEDLVDRGALHAGVLLLTRSGCLPLLAEGATDLRDPCQLHNARAIAVIDSLIDGGRDVRVVLSGRWGTFRSASTDLAVGRLIRERPDTLEFGRRLWITLERTSRASGRVLVMATPPSLRYRAPQCLLQWGLSPEACGLTRAEAVDSRLPFSGVVEATVARADRARLYDVVPALCGPERCDVSRDGVILMRDAMHLSLSGARKLAPDVAPALSWLVSNSPPSGAP